MSTSEFRTGYLAVIGRPNVGKSTLMNHLVGAKVSITSRKAQTTRHCIHGILTTDACQFVFVDTPGFQMQHKNALHRLMNRSVNQALGEVDVVLFVVEAGKFGNRERDIVHLLPHTRPVLLVINKIDRLGNPALALPFIDAVSKEFPFTEIVPVSAAKGSNLDQLLRAAALHLPVGPAIFDADDITDRSERFLAAELLREKLFRNLGEELPYGMTVEIEKFETENVETERQLRRIFAAIVVDREAHRGMVIGKGGEKLKGIAADARRDMEKLFGGKVWLETWVKVKSGWADDERALKSLGYE
jgi:GTP-binding protein Era